MDMVWPLCDLISLPPQRPLLGDDGLLEDRARQQVGLASRAISSQAACTHTGLGLASGTPTVTLPDAWQQVPAE